MDELEQYSSRGLNTWGSCYGGERQWTNNQKPHPGSFLGIRRCNTFGREWVGNKEQIASYHLEMNCEVEVRCYFSDRLRSHVVPLSSYCVGSKQVTNSSKCQGRINSSSFWRKVLEQQWTIEQSHMTVDINSFKFKNQFLSHCSHILSTQYYTRTWNISNLADSIG